MRINLYALFTVVFLSGNFCAFAQNFEISGESTVYVGQTTMYGYPGWEDVPLPSPKWVIPAGTVRAPLSLELHSYTVNITWTTPGTFTVKFRTDDGVLATKLITILVPCSVSVPTNVAGATRCGAGQVTLSATAGAGGSQVKWFDGQGTLVSTSSTYSPTLSQTTTFYVSTFDPNTNCYSSAVTVQAVVNITSVPGKINGAIPVCGSGSFNLYVLIIEGGDGFEYRWYNAPSGGSILRNGPELHVFLSSTKTYYATRFDPVTGCESERKPVTAKVIPFPDPPTVTGNMQFGGRVTDITAFGTAEDGTYRWYSPANLTTPLFEGNPYHTPALTGSKPDYVYVSEVAPGVLNGCEGPKAPVSVLVIPVPGITATSYYVAKLYPVTLSSTPANYSYDTYTWKNANGDVVATALSFQTNQTGSYRLTVTKSGLSYTTGPVVLKRQFDDLDMNYIVTNTFQTSNLPTHLVIDDLPVEKSTQTIQYFDGFGRPVQSIGTQSSPTKGDMVQPIVYNDYGFEQKKYLPYTSGESNGRYKSSALTAQGVFYVNGFTDKVADDTKPYAATVFHNDPLGQIVKQGAPGAAWQPDGVASYASTDNTIKTSDEFNGENEVVRLRYAYSSPSIPLGSVTAGAQSFYVARELYRKAVKDEHGNEAITFTNKQGQTILKKVKASPSVFAETYYLYDDFGNLSCVLPPEAMSRLNTEYFQSGATDATREAFLARWAFRYTYDGRSRMTQKQVPGAGAVYMVYDNRDRLVMIQDANQRVNKQWAFTKYDGFDRTVLTGIYTADSILIQGKMQRRVNYFYSHLTTATAWFETYKGNVSGNVHGYDNKSYPQESNALNYLTATYYDTYDVISTWTGDYDYYNDQLTETVGSITYDQPAGKNTRVWGQVTGSKTKVLDGGIVGGYTWLKAAVYYDDKYRTIQSKADNYKGGVDRVSTLYDFTGKILKTSEAHISQDVEWISVAGAEVTGNKLTKTVGSANWTTAGAASSQLLQANEDGWLEVTVSEINTSRMIGLASSNPNLSYTNINYAVYLNDATLKIFEITPPATAAAVVYTHSTSLKSGDVVRAERTGTTIRYKLNGNLIFTSATPSTTPLMVDASLYDTRAALVGARTSFGKTEKQVTHRFVYDHAARLTEVWHAVDSRPEVRITYNEYNELGQLVDKKLHSTTIDASNARQSVDYRYNIRGWLTSINNASLSDDGQTNNEPTDYFGMNLAYNSTLGAGGTPQYNGNISGITWSKDLGKSTVKQNGYAFTYDPLNRLTAANHKELTSAWSTGKYDEGGLTYDLNGNITHLDRKGNGGAVIDNLTYNYGTGGNQLAYVQDNTTNATDRVQGFTDRNTGTAVDYTYDANGNMTRDLNKGIGASINDATNLIAYNLLNLPETVTKAGNTVRYIYDATGRKLAQQVTTGAVRNQTDYIGGFVYENDVLQFLNHEEGRVVLSDQKLIYANSFADINTAEMTSTNTTLGTTTVNGENYVTATASNSTSGSGVLPIGGVMNVHPGDRFKVRVKGYTTGANNAYLQFRAGSTIMNSPGAILPNSSATESWIEQVIAIPADVTTLRAGVVWTTVTPGQVINLNEFEIIKLDATEPEYQYHLKDHLGNVRLTFTTKREVEGDTVTFEASRMAEERIEFLRYGNARKVLSPIFDHTNGASTGYAQRLNGSANERYGVGRSVSVMPGDTINMEVYAKYIDRTTSNLTQSLQALLLQVANGTAPAGTVVDGAGYSASTSSFPYGGLNGASSSPDGGPKAYLNWLVFDRDFNYLDGGYQPLSNAPLEQGQNVPHERLYGQTVIKTAGYVYVYVSNEGTTTPYEVYFDDLSVEYIKSPIIQAEDYYPFGLTFNSYQRENSKRNDYLYNGKERQSELGLQWLDYGARMYMPEIGRWGVTDPHAEKYMPSSPYSYAFDSPTIIVDPNGKDGVLYMQVMGKTTDAERKMYKAAVSLINDTFKELNIDLRAEVHYSDKIMSKLDFYSREGADGTDSYLLLGDTKKLHEASIEAESKGWDKIWGDGKDRDFAFISGQASRKDHFALLNRDYTNKRIRQMHDNMVMEEDDYKSPTERVAIVTRHEDGHTKFGPHVEGTIMQPLPMRDSRYNQEMLNRLKALHGTIKPEVSANKATYPEWYRP